MPDEDIPPGLQVLEGEEDIKPLSNDQKYLSIDLFDDLKEAHDRTDKRVWQIVYTSERH